MRAGQFRTRPRAHQEGRSAYIGAFPRRGSGPWNTMKVDVRETNPRERGVLQALYWTRLLNLLTPYACKGDAINNWQSIWVETFIWVVTNISCYLYTLSNIFHVHISDCDVFNESSPSNVCFDMNANSHIVEVYVFNQDILHSAWGFTSHCYSSEWGWSCYPPDSDVGAWATISDSVFIPSAFYSYKIISSGNVWIFYADVRAWICVELLMNCKNKVQEIRSSFHSLWYTVFPPKFHRLRSFPSKPRHTTLTNLCNL